MNLITMSTLSNSKLDKYLEDYRGLMPTNYSCIWNKNEHTGSSATTWQRFKSHCEKCKYKSEHKEVVNEKHFSMIYPTYLEDDEETYRGALALMNMCYEFQVERLEPGWQNYDNRLLHLLIKFFSKFCNMGRPGYQQSVQQSESGNCDYNWKVKKTEDSEVIGMTHSEMFKFFCDEFKPLLKKQLQYVDDSGSYNFWYLVIYGKRCSSDQAYRAMVKKANDGEDTTRIVGPHKIGSKGEIIFT